LELVLVEEQESSLWRKDRRYGRAGDRILDQRRYGFALSGGKRGDVAEPGHLRVIAGFGDHDAAIRVAD
jgi:hypothetical protein